MDRDRRFGEPSAAALARELTEQLGHELPVGPGQRFRWTPVRELGAIDFRPAGLAPILPGLTSSLRHVVLSAP